ncbi:MAG: DUF2804 family protein [Spirochaetales bacterium]
MGDEEYQEIENPQELLDINGCIIREGWARRPLFHYDRSLISVPIIRTKEWERFIISDDAASWLVVASINHIGSRIGYSITYVDLENRKVFNVHHKHTANDKNRLSQSSRIDDEHNYSCPDMRLAVIRRANIRNVLFCAPRFDICEAERGIDARFILNQDLYAQSFVTAESMSKNRKSFLLNEIISLVPVSGILRRGNVTETIKANSTHAVIDWGRGRFSVRPMFKALFCNGKIGLSMLSRRCCSVSINGKIHIIEDVTTRFTEGGFSAKSKDGKLDIALKNGIVQQSSSALQTFGCLQGSVTFENGKTITFSNMPGVTWRVSKHPSSLEKKASGVRIEALDSGSDHLD